MEDTTLSSDDNILISDSGEPFNLCNRNTIN